MCILWRFWLLGEVWMISPTRVVMLPYGALVDGLN